MPKAERLWCAVSPWTQSLPKVRGSEVSVPFGARCLVLQGLEGMAMEFVSHAHKEFMI